MKHNLLSIFMFFLISAKLYAQADERIYFYDGNWETGIILEIIPDSSLTLEKDSGEIETYLMRDIKKVVKRFPESLEGGIHNQTLAGALSINGGIYLSKYEGSYYRYIFDPSFNIYPVTNMSIGFTVYIENTSKILSLKDAAYSVGGSVRYYMGAKANKPFIAAEIAVKSESHLEYEISISAGYNCAISKNLALQPIVKLGFLNFDDTAVTYTRVTFGIGIVNYIF